MAHLGRPQRNSHRTEEAARTHPHVGLSWALPEGLQRPKEAGTRPLGPPGDSCQLPGRQALSRSPCTPVTRRPLPEFPLAANSSALPRPHTHAHPRHNTTHTHLHSTRTHARTHVRTHAHRLSSAGPQAPRFSSCSGATPGFPVVEHWSTGQALGHGVAPGSAPLAFGNKARPCGGASLWTGSFSPHLLGNVSVNCRGSYYFT